MQKSLEKKPNLHDVLAMINKSVLQSNLENFKSSIDKLYKELNSRVELGKFEAMVTDTFQAIEDLQKDLMSKSSIKEVISLIKNKTGKI